MVRKGAGVVAKLKGEVRLVRKDDMGLEDMSCERVRGVVSRSLNGSLVSAASRQPIAPHRDKPCFNSAFPRAWRIHNLASLVIHSDLKAPGGVRYATRNASVLTAGCLWVGDSDES